MQRIAARLLQHLGEEFVSKVTSMTTQQQAGKVALSEAPSVREVGSHTSSDHRAASLEVSVAVMQVDTDACGGDGGWATHGWWNLNPGESKTAIWTKYDAAYFYA